MRWQHMRMHVFKVLQARNASLNSLLAIENALGGEYAKWPEHVEFVVQRAEAARRLSYTDSLGLFAVDKEATVQNNC